MKKLFILIAVLATMSVAGCYKHCAGFDKEFIQHYFPYTPGQGLTFASSTGETIPLVVSKISYPPHPYDIGFGVKEDCTQILEVIITDTASKHDFDLNFVIGNYGTADMINRAPSLNNPYHFFVVKFTNSSAIRDYYHIDPPDSNYIDFAIQNNISAYENSLCSYIDTINFTIRGNNDIRRSEEVGCKYVIDTFVVVKDKGLARFVTHDGCRYELVD